MIILVGMWLCIFYCIIKCVFKSEKALPLIIYFFAILAFFALIGSDAGHTGLGVVLGLIFGLFGIFCIAEGEKRINEQENTNKEIEAQNKYDDDLGFNDFNR